LQGNLERMALLAVKSLRYLVQWVRQHGWLTVQGWKKKLKN
jgi:hypothetical protein